MATSRSELRRIAVQTGLVRWQPSFGPSYSTVFRFCGENVRRTGGELRLAAGQVQVYRMMAAWEAAQRLYAESQVPRGDPGQLLTVLDSERLCAWAALIEPAANRSTGFRRCEASMVGKACPAYDEVPRLVDQWFETYSVDPVPLEAYKALLEIRPWTDGNGRLGKLVLNFLNCSLWHPVFPPNDLWGRRMTNP